MGSTSLHAALSSLGQTKETHSTDNTVLETCDMAVAEWHNTFEADFNQKIHGLVKNYYCVTLMISMEQENAIVELFKERHWSYLKLEHGADSSQRFDLRNNIPISKGGQEAFSSEKAKDLQSAEDDRLPRESDYDTYENSNSNTLSSSLSFKDDQKGVFAAKEQDRTEITVDPVQHSIDESQRINNEIRGSTNSTVDKIFLDSDIPVCHSSSNISTESQIFEQDGHIELTASRVNTEIKSSSTDTLLVVKDDSEVPDIVAFQGISNETRNDNTISKIQSTPHAKGIHCKDCEHTFQSRIRYERHLKEDKCKHVCEFCGKIFLHKCTRKYNIHMKYHRKQKDHVCKFCGKGFVEYSDMTTHVKVHTDPRPICDKCGKVFKTAASLKAHMVNVHVEKRDKFQCSKCANIYLSQGSLTYHMRSTHESTDSFPCLTCNKTFKHKRLLKIHEVTHSDTRDIKCDKCDASFKRQCGLYSHMQIHDKAYKLFCTTCNKGFHEKRKLREHENTHSGFKPYACSYCDYRCASSSNLPKHMKIHRKDTSNT